MDRELQEAFLGERVLKLGDPSPEKHGKRQRKREAQELCSGWLDLPRFHRGTDLAEHGACHERLVRFPDRDDRVSRTWPCEPFVWKTELIEKRLPPPVCACSGD